MPWFSENKLVIDTALKVQIKEWRHQSEFPLSRHPYIVSKDYINATNFMAQQ